MALVDKSDLSLEELSLLGLELDKRRKSSSTMWILWWFLGGLGGHRFYLGDPVGWVLVVCTVLAPFTGFITLIGSGIFLIVDAFTNSSRLQKANEKIEAEVLAEIRQLRHSRANSQAIAETAATK